MVVARDAKVETMGVMAELPPDLSPFQIGTRGEWKGAGFEIVGRIRVSWAEGSWNEWCLLCGGQTIGWLAEAQGLLMISFAVETGSGISRREDFEPGRKMELAGEKWTVTDVKETECIASEGELPFTASPARLRFSADLIAPNGRFGSIEFDDDGTRLYAGTFAEFGELKFQNLRAVSGWSAEALHRNHHSQLPHGAAEPGFTDRSASESDGGMVERSPGRLRSLHFRFRARRSWRGRCRVCRVTARFACRDSESRRDRGSG